MTKYKNKMILISKIKKSPSKLFGELSLPSKLIEEISVLDLEIDKNNSCKTPIQSQI